MDNKSGKEIPGRRALKDFSEFAKDDVKPKVSSQHALAVYQYLSTGIWNSFLITLILAKGYLSVLQ